ARDMDSVMFCLSKGLGAPAGSMLVGNAEHVEQGRLYRKRLGGGMRQAGVLAAAGLIALEESPKLLERDHQNALYLAHRLAEMPGIKLDVSRVRTNIVIFDISALEMSTAEFSTALKAGDVLANGIDATHMRMVTHLDAGHEECERAADVLEKLVSRRTFSTSAV
ncbi:MAG: low specificity L-threonine aldolase, partial [Acidobacteriaceae bacterium]|nr:low specificity L-threonine aldolase [Acidobacteriaceae bacterium]